MLVGVVSYLCFTENMQFMLHSTSTHPLLNLIQKSFSPFFGIHLLSQIHQTPIKHRVTHANMISLYEKNGILSREPR